MAVGSVPGSYVAGDTPLHRVDPRVKLGLLAVWTVALFSVGSWAALGCVAAAVIALAVSAHVPLARMAAGLAPLLAVFTILALGSALRFDGSAAWTVVGPVGVDPAGLASGLRAVARIALMAALSLLATSTTTATVLTEALVCVMGPLRRLRVPVDDLATMLSVALRFIPVCAEQLDRVVLAQRARGARVGEGGPVRRVVSWVPVMVPLFVGLFRRSDALAAAMRARCYRGVGRTRLTTLRLRPVDAAVLALGCALAAATAVLF